MSATGSTPASVIEESLPHEGWPSADGEDLPPGIGPYRLAWRRLKRNKVALAFGALFLVIVILCLLAPVYAKYVAHTGPNDEHVDTALNQFGLPIGPTWHANTSSARTTSGGMSPSACSTAGATRSRSGLRRP